MFLELRSGKIEGMRKAHGIVRVEASHLLATVMLAIDAPATTL